MKPQNRRHGHQFDLVSTALATALAAGVMLTGSRAAAQPAPPFGLPDRGVLRLQLGESIEQSGLHAPKRFVYEPPGGGPGLSDWIGITSKCLLQLTGPTDLATLTATGGRNKVGAGPDSIGVFDGPKGTACYRITASQGESLRFDLGNDVPTSPLIMANAFYRLELDIEVKKDAEFLLETLIGEAVTAQYLLRSGSSIVAGEGSEDPGSLIFNCAAASDSGPDSGRRDNCRWIVEELGQSFRLTATNGEGSWEGGGDFGADAYVNNSIIFLTEAEAIGALGCEANNDTTPTIGDDMNDAQCSVISQDPGDSGGQQCETLVGYIFRTLDSAVEGCELISAPNEQLVANIFVTFPAEDAPPLVGNVWSPLALTEVTFGNDPLQQSFPLDRCPGTRTDGDDGPVPIPEILNSGPDGSFDLIPGNGTIEFACVFDRKEIWIGGDPQQVILEEGIQFFGDIRFSRR
jgi:hypothetical protein